MGKSELGIAVPKGMSDWEVEEDLRTLCRADKINADPKRKKTCHDLARKRMMEMANIASEGKEKD